MLRTSIRLAEGRAAPPALGRSRTRSGLTLFILIAITALAPAALHMLVPSLPLLARVFAGTSGGVQLVLTVFPSGSPQASSFMGRSRTGSAAARR